MNRIKDLSAALAVAAMAGPYLTVPGGVTYDMRRPPAPKAPKPKRKFKGSKAAKKASRRKAS